VPMVSWLKEEKSISVEDPKRNIEKWWVKLYKKEKKNKEEGLGNSKGGGGKGVRAYSITQTERSQNTQQRQFSRDN